MGSGRGRENDGAPADYRLLCTARKNSRNKPLRNKSPHKSPQADSQAGAQRKSAVVVEQKELVLCCTA